MEATLAVTSVLAILLSPLVAVLVTRWLDDRRRRRDFKRAVLQALLANRHQKTCAETIQALNLVDFAFFADDGVRKLFREYMEMLGNKGLTSADTGWEQIEEKFGDMTTAMAGACGLGGKFTFQDVRRVYAPIALANDATKSEELRVALLQFLASNGTAGSVAPRDATNQTQSDTGDDNGAKKKD